MQPQSLASQNIAICPHCLLRQRRGGNTNRCRRCRHLIDPSCLILPLLRQEMVGDPHSQVLGIGRRIRQIRIRAGFTQATFAKALGTTGRSYLSKVENSRAIPSLCTLVHMAQVLRLTPADLFTALFS